MISDAVFSTDRKYRYLLTRIWDDSKEKVGFICLNPSTADEKNDDPTIRRCIGYAKSWGYGGLVLGNIFSYRTPYPKILFNAILKGIHPVGPANDLWLLRIAETSDLVVAAWGNHGDYLNRAPLVRKLLKNKLHVLKLTKGGMPAHPLYLKKELKPLQWKNGNEKGPLNRAPEGKR